MKNRAETEDGCNAVDKVVSRFGLAVRRCEASKQKGLGSTPLRLSFLDTLFFSGEKKEKRKTKS